MPGWLLFLMRSTVVREVRIHLSSKMRRGRSLITTYEKIICRISWGRSVNAVACSFLRLGLGDRVLNSDLQRFVRRRNTDRSIGGSLATSAIERRTGVAVRVRSCMVGAIVLRREHYTFDDTHVPAVFALVIDLVGFTRPVKVKCKSTYD